MGLSIDIRSKPASLLCTDIKFQSAWAVYPDLGAPDLEGGQVGRSTVQCLEWCLAIEGTCCRPILEPCGMPQCLAP
jgi:hypothetical protein